MDDRVKTFAELANDMASDIRAFIDALEAYVKGECEYAPGDWIDYGKPVYPIYVPVGSFRPLEDPAGAGKVPVRFRPVSPYQIRGGIHGC